MTSHLDNDIKADCAQAVTTDQDSEEPQIHEGSVDAPQMTRALFVTQVSRGGIEADPQTEGRVLLNAYRQRHAFALPCCSISHAVFTEENSVFGAMDIGSIIALVVVPVLLAAAGLGGVAWLKRRDRSTRDD